MSGLFTQGRFLIGRIRNSMLMKNTPVTHKLLIAIFVSIIWSKNFMFRTRLCFYFTLEILEFLNMADLHTIGIAKIFRDKSSTNTYKNLLNVFVLIFAGIPEDLSILLVCLPL